MNSKTRPDAPFEALLDYVKRTRGFDFNAYKRNSVMRRIRKRMQAIDIEDFDDYITYLEVHPEELAYFLNTVLINVTSFFRDREAWSYLEKKIITRLLADKRDGQPVRIWSAGCASGEEAYSLAILLSEAMGTDAFQSRVKIYASDVDDDALIQARAAVYTAAQLEPVPAELRAKYFVPHGDQFVFRGDLRGSVTFERHDLVQDAPISRLDLLVCRNTLMYLNPEVQGSILARFHLALNERGILFLGKAEMLLTHTNLFSPTEMKYRVFSKMPGATTGPASSPLSRLTTPPSPNPRAARRG